MFICASSLITRKRLLVFLIFVLSSAFSGAREASYAGDSKPTEYEVKAAFIYNFAKFIEWPDGKSREARGAINVCVVGKDPFGPALAAIEGKTVRDRKIRITRDPSLQNATRCDILFVGSSEEERLTRILEALGNSGILTIGDTEGFAQKGVMINFYVENRTVRFEINPKAAVRTGLRISSNLLRIAKIVGEH